jgi:hypothetical protein
MQGQALASSRSASSLVRVVEGSDCQQKAGGESAAKEGAIGRRMVKVVKGRVVSGRVRSVCVWRVW